jgi:hypothetical protein
MPAQGIDIVIILSGLQMKSLIGLFRVSIERLEGMQLLGGS